jgi:hypothetical protein
MLIFKSEKFVNGVDNQCQFSTITLESVYFMYNTLIINWLYKTQTLDALFRLTANIKFYIIFVDVN